MDKKLSSLVYDQIALEQYSSALYLSMAAYADDNGLFALSCDLLKHASEEQEHARKWISFLFARGAGLALRSVDAPPASDSWNPVGLCKAAVAHEERVTASILAIRNAAMTAGDTHLEEKCREFLREQTEEEDVAQDRLSLATMAPDPGTFDLLVAKKG